MEQYLAVANEVLNRIIAPPGAPPTAVQQRLFGVDPGAGGRSQGGGAEDRPVARPGSPTAGRRRKRRSKCCSACSRWRETREVVPGSAAPDAEGDPGVAAVSLHHARLRRQTGDAKPADGIVALDDYQLASRLSYLLWATMPDAELSVLADAGKLHDPQVLAGSGPSPDGDPRSRALFDGFGAQWLGLDKLAGKTFDAAKFPQMTGDLRASMYDEARLLFDSILRENRSLTTFIDSDYTFLNGTLATIYGWRTRSPARRCER